MSFSLFRFVFVIFFTASCSTPSPIQSSAPQPSVLPPPIASPTPFLRDASIKVRKNKPQARLDASGTQTMAAGEKENGFKFDTTIDPQNWKLISDEEGVQTYEKITEKDDKIAFRGEMIIPTSLLRIATVLNDNELRKQWIDALLETHTVKQMSPVEKIEYNHTKVQWPFQDRDFVYHVDVKLAEKPRAMMISMKSIEDAGEPAKEKIVRGEIIYSYYYMKELNPGQSTKVIVEMSVDPKGAIPKWLVHLAQKKWPHNTLKHMSGLAVKKDLVVSKEIEEYFNEQGGKK